MSCVYVLEYEIEKRRLVSDYTKYVRSGSFLFTGTRDSFLKRFNHSDNKPRLDDVQVERFKAFLDSGKLDPIFNGTFDYYSDYVTYCDHYQRDGDSDIFECLSITVISYDRKVADLDYSRKWALEELNASLDKLCEEEGL